MEINHYQPQFTEKLFPHNPRFTYITVNSGGNSGEVLIGGRDTQTRVKVIIKQPQSSAAKDIRERHATDIVREARALQLLENEKNICTLLDNNKEEDVDGITTYAYLVTTFAEGNNLSDLSEEYRQPDVAVPWTEILIIIKQLATLLARAHDLGIVHNDVSLHHVFWNRKTGELKLIDWGNVVFYREEPDKAHPPADIHQIGELCYKLLTGNCPTAANKIFRLEMPGLPKGLDTVMMKALKCEYETMHALGQDIDKIYEQIRQSAQIEWQELKNRASFQDPSLSYLEELKSDLENWPNRLACAQEVNRLIENIDNKIHQLQYRSSWEIVRTYLYKAEYKNAINFMKQLPENYDSIDIKLLRDFCQIAEQMSSDDMQPIIRNLLVGKEIEALKTLVAHYTPHNDEIPKALLEAIYLLSRKYEIPTIRANLEWLELTINRLTSQLATDWPVKRLLLNIDTEIIIQIEDLNKTGLCLVNWEQAYQRVANTLQNVKTELLQIDQLRVDSEVIEKFNRLSQDVQWLHVGAKGIEKSLHSANDTWQVNNYEEMIANLEQACNQDPSNPSLFDLLNDAQARQTLTDLNQQPAPQGWDEAEKLLKQYKEILQKITQYTQTDQPNELERQFYDPSRQLEPFKPFPPLYTFFKNIPYQGRFTDQLQRAETFIQQGDMELAYEQLSKIKNSPINFQNSNVVFYLSVFKLMSTGFNAWKSGQYQEAMHKFELAEQNIIHSTIRRQLVIESLMNWVKRFKSLAEEIVNQLDQTQSQLTQGPSSPEAWKVLEDQLQKIRQDILDLTKWDEQKLSFIQHQIAFQKELQEAYNRDPNKFIILATHDGKVTNAHHPFWAIYKQWANNLQKQQAVPQKPTSVVSTFASRLQEIQLLIRNKEMPVALERLKALQSDDLSNFQNSEGQYYLDFLTNLKSGYDALKSGHYKAAQSNFATCSEASKHRSSSSPEVWRILNESAESEQRRVTKILL